MLKTRQSGILLHPTSLPGPEGIGTLGDEAYAFVDYLASAGQTVWQILPLGPTGYGDCPYSSFSAFAGNTDLISLARLVENGDLDPSDLPPQDTATDRIDFSTCRQRKTPLLQKAAHNFFTQQEERNSEHKFEIFCRLHQSWLDDYTFYRAMRREQKQRGWHRWPTEIRDRKQSALHQFGTELQEEIRQEKYLQFIFFEQWLALKKYANQKGVQIFGDLPIFVAYDSVDVWANRPLFQLDKLGQPNLVAGVPPDYFSKTGQLWGNPLYDWQELAKDNYSWWTARLKWNLELFDLVRIDHFRGFEACWAVPSDETTAINGNWQTGPGRAFFEQMLLEFDALPLIAEDLGIITPQVEQLRDRFNLPGMKILQFAFDSGPQNPYLPHQHSRNSVVYTGTHDNNTSLAWWKALDAEQKQSVRNYFDSSCRDMPWPLIRSALASTAKLAIIPMQDILKLGGNSRMNRPGTASGNWNWRMLASQLDATVAERLILLCRQFDRIPIERKNY